MTVMRSGICKVSRVFPRSAPQARGPLFGVSCGSMVSAPIFFPSEKTNEGAARAIQTLGAYPVPPSRSHHRVVLVPKVAELFGEERFESVKTSALAVLFAVVPEAIGGLLDPDRLTPRWELQLDALALQAVLFGLVYRYAVREGDDNPMQRMGVLAAFAVPRALFLVAPPPCTAAPLSCGEPLGYFSWSMLGQAAKHLLIGGATLGAALYGLERAFAVGLVRRFRGGS
ncbi:unnamed protein product [Prorocentrum cordatum]|uniref:Uncharacterized protein n=1 Tax=Prorocentrum cordatum TaxID=2364126 RepID=A0ABN9UR66_9DINO|nr:unnamed protein product [Polarella glacialis]